MAKDKVIADGVLKTAPVKWQELEFLQSANFKDLTPEGFEKLKTSILQNDFCETFKVWENGKKIYCLDGFHRCKALESLKADGYAIPEEFQASFIKCKNKKDAAKKVLIYSSVYAKMTDEGLYEFSHDWGLDWEEIKFEVDLPDFNIGKYEEGYIYDNEYDEEKDEVPEPPKEAKSKLGDLYLLGGRHRLLCGDCENKKELDRLIDGVKIDLVLTDPPYGINIVKIDKHSIGGSKPYGKTTNKAIVGKHTLVETTSYLPIHGDDKPFNPEWILETFKGNKILFGGNYYASKLSDSRCWVIWDKQVSGTFQPIEMAWTDFDKLSKLYSFMWSGVRREGGRDEELVKRVHPTQKPVGLFKMILEDFSEENHNIWDGYGGSGSTLIACEQTNRTCYMSEIEPLYIDVIIKRYQDYTGEDVEKIKDGKK